MRKIPFRNYFILSIILVLTIFISFVIMNLFKSINHDDSDNAFKNKISFSELETYLLENPDFIIYFTDNRFDNSIFEKKFKKFIINNDLGNQLVCMDITNTNKNDFLSFISKYGQEQMNMELTNYIIIIDNQKIVSLIAITPDLRDLNMIKKEFKEKGVI